jgi:formylglycine-generating enzyme
MSAPGEEMVWIPGGAFLMVSERHYPEEAPVHKVAVSGFWMDRSTVTNSEFGSRFNAH